MDRRDEPAVVSVFRAWFTRGVAGRRRRRFGVEVMLALLSAALFTLTLFRRDWIEVVFGADPDRGSGALELVVTAALLAVALTAGWLARGEWRRALTARTRLWPPA
jgi:hypothetical protein